MNKFFKFEEIDETFGGTGWVLVGINSTHDPMIVYANNGDVEVIEDLESGDIQSMIEQARALCDIPRNATIYVDSEGILNPDYISSEEYLFEPENFNPYGCSDDDLEDYIEWCSK